MGDRKYKLLNRYGLTTAQYDALSKKQGGRCAICRRPPRNNKVLEVDHIHGNGAVRGLLCSPCNIGIARLGDNVEGVQRAVAYLARRPHDAAVVANGYPPSADKVLAVDFDRTLYPSSDLLGYPKPIRGAVSAMKAFKKAGYTLVILTSRMSPTWWKSEGWVRAEAKRVQYEYVRSLLERDGIPFDRVTDEKVPSVAIIDDRAIEFKGNWKAIKERILNG